MNFNNCVLKANKMEIDNTNIVRIIIVLVIIGYVDSGMV